ncbi:hypothetical protein F2Q69_00016970 [Brassica cretica]|uniref:Uncharacterized protein n=1 Tax=Brassica cretica TaxID=69181 RepID=A0A8S9R4H6_BRACR|nr:hypothetical protein F2Q69_00016970 [Brassica cretica]
MADFWLGCPIFFSGRTPSLGFQLSFDLSLMVLSSPMVRVSASSLSSRPCKMWRSFGLSLDIFMAPIEGSSFGFSLRILVLRRFGFGILLVVFLKSSDGLFFFDVLFPLCPVDRREVVPVTIFSVKTGRSERHVFLLC